MAFVVHSTLSDSLLTPIRSYSFHISYQRFFVQRNFFTALLDKE